VVSVTGPYSRILDILDTRNNLDLHYRQSHLSVHQKGVHYTGIKVFNRLPVLIKQYILYIILMRVVW
jgi:hypothetical protein